MRFKTQEGQLPRAARHQPDGRQGRIRHADRPLGLRQVHAAEPDRRPDHAHRRACCCAPTARSRPRARSARVVFQNHSLLPWLTCFENVHLAVERVFGGERDQGAAQGPHRRRAGTGGPGATPRTSARTRSRAA